MSFWLNVTQKKCLLIHYHLIKHHASLNVVSCSFEKHSHTPWNCRLQTPYNQCSHQAKKIECIRIHGNRCMMLQLGTCEQTAKLLDSVMRHWAATGQGPIDVGFNQLQPTASFQGMWFSPDLTQAQCCTLSVSWTECLQVPWMRKSMSDPYGN